MTTPNAESRRRWVWKAVLIAAAVGIIAISLAAWYATTDSFQAHVRNRFVNELERVTGGRVELGSIHSVPFRFQVEVRNLTIHGNEGPSEVPYAHVDSLVARVKLISVLGAELGFHSITLDHPVFHIIVYPNGKTNQPVPKNGSGTTAGTLEHLFKLSANLLQVRQGELLWKDQKIPLDLTLSDVSANMDYSFLHRKYEGNVSVGKMDGRFLDYRPTSLRAEARFELANDSLVIDSLTATSGRSQLRANGRVVDFNQPNAIGQYDLTLNLAETGAIIHDSELRNGVLRITGNGSWSRSAFSTEGKLQGKDIDWHPEGVNFEAANLGADFSLNPQRLQLRNILGKLWGGEVNGDAQIIGWQNPQPSGTRQKNDVQSGLVRLRLKDLSAQAIAVALSSAGRPFYRLELAGLASGALETRWKGSIKNAETDLSLDVAPPAEVAEKRLPLNARIRASYRSAPGELQLTELTADTRATQVHASGTMSKTAALNVSVTTSNFGEWEYVLNALGYQERLPFNLQGRASFSGTATGRLSEIEFTGRLQSQDSELILQPKPGNQQRTIRWDLLTASLQLSPHLFAARNGRLRQGGSMSHFDINAELDKRQFTDASPFRASLQMQGGDASEVAELIGYPNAITGNLDLTLQAAGTRATPAGSGSLHLTGAKIHGADVQTIDSKFDFKGSQLSLEDIHFAQDQGEVHGSGSYDFSTRAFLLNLNGTNFDLAHVPMVASNPLAIQGSIDFVAEASGSPEHPNINAKVHVRDLGWNHQPLGEYLLDAVTQGSELRLSGKSQFNNAQLNLQGEIHLQNDWPAKIDLEFNHLSVEPLLGVYLGNVITGPSTAAGEIHLRGPVRDLSQMQITGNLNNFAVDLEHVQLHNDDPFRFVVSNDILNIERFHLVGQDTSLELGGTLQLRGHQLQLHAEGNFDLALIHSLNPAVNSSGAVALDITAHGTLEHPSLQGRMQVSHGVIQYSDMPSALSDLNGSLVFNQDRLQIETLTGTAGGGSVNFGGYANLYNRQLNFDLTMTAKDVRLRYPPGVSSMTTADLRWSGTSAASTLTGDATVTKLAITPGFDFGSYLEGTSQSSALPQTNSVLSSIRMNLHIVTTPDLQMQTAALSLEGNADLHLRGTVAKPVILGRADILEGQIVFNGTKYRMERGDISFANPVTTTPVLDLQASTHVREYDVMVNLNGPLDKLNLSYHSEPPLPTADIISLLAPVGSTQQQFGNVQQQTGQSPFVQQASSAVLAEALNSALSNRSQRLFGISHIKIDPQGLNTETTPTQTSPLPAVTIEQQVRDNVTLTYTTNVAQTSQQIIQGEYNITRNLSIVGIRDFNGVVSFELRVRQRKK